jgi:cytochrome c553
MGSAHAAPQGDAAAGKNKAQACAGCHGADGNSATPNFPKLAGQGASYLFKQLQDFKSGDRKNAIMSGQVANLNEQDMADLAAYFSQQDPTIGTADKDKVQLGENIYRGGVAEKNVPACMGCHGPAGSGNPPAKFPRLSGQHAAYVESTLKAFRSGDRHNDAGMMMRGVAQRMSDKEIAAVASYVSGLH